MEVIKNLIIKFRHVGVLFLIGVIVITYVAFGFLYWQQGGQQKEYEEKITRLDVILSRPLPGVEKLQAEYEAVNLALAPMTIVRMANTYMEPESAPFDDIDVAAIVMLIGIAAENGIDISEASGDFFVPKAKFNSVKMGGGSYQVLSFGGIKVQGNYDNVMAFISDLDSGKTLKTMVLKKVTTTEVKIVFAGEKGARRTEFRNVAAAVLTLMKGVGLTQIPDPISFAAGVATDNMSGFPDITATAAERGYSGNATPRDGFVLYEHDKISTDNTTQFESVNYISALTTSYYYTSEVDGTVRQFDGANVATATEYLDRESSKMELRATMDVSIYLKP